MCIMDWSSALCSSDLETIFDPQLEPVGDAEGEGERRVVFPRLDRVDRLARHFEPLGEIALAPVALGAQDLEAVLHAPRIRCQICATPSPIAQTGTTIQLSTCGTTLKLSRKPPTVPTISRKPRPNSALMAYRRLRYSSVTSTQKK